MGTLIVRNVDEGVLQQMRVRAANLKLSVEALHRQILGEAFASEQPMTLAEFLLTFPKATLEFDPFERSQEDVGTRDQVFD